MCIEPQLIEQWYREKGMLVFSLRSKEAMATVLDVLVKPTAPFEELRRNATLLNMVPLQIPVASVEHLIAMKSGTGRGKDRIDIEELQKIHYGGKL